MWKRAGKEFSKKIKPTVLSNHTYIYIYIGSKSCIFIITTGLLVLLCSSHYKLEIINKIFLLFYVHCPLLNFLNFYNITKGWRNERNFLYTLFLILVVVLVVVALYKSFVYKLTINKQEETLEIIYIIWNEVHAVYVYPFN